MIPFNDLRPSLAPLCHVIDRSIRRVVDSGVFLNGDEVPRFEEEFARYCGTKHCIACASGTDAISLMCAALPKTLPVCVQANTLPCTAIGVERSGESITIVDCLPDGRCDVHWKNTMPVLLYGRYPVGTELDCSIFDACQAHGWKPPVSVNAAAMSFFPTKNLGAFGDSGCVVTHADHIADAIRKIQDVRRYDSHMHFHSRMSEIDAAVLSVKLPHLDEWNAERARLAAVYYDNLPAWCEPVTKPGEETNHHLFAVLVDRRDELMEHLLTHGVVPKVHYDKPLWLKPNAMRWCSRVLSLPLWVGMTPEQVQTVCDAVRGFQST